MKKKLIVHYHGLVMLLKHLRCFVIGHRISQMYPKIVKVWEKWNEMANTEPYYFLVDKQTTMIHGSTAHVLCKACDRWQHRTYAQLTT